MIYVFFVLLNSLLVWFIRSSAWKHTEIEAGVKFSGSRFPAVGHLLRGLLVELQLALDPLLLLLEDLGYDARLMS